MGDSMIPADRSAECSTMTSADRALQALSMGSLRSGWGTSRRNDVGGERGDGYAPGSTATAVADR
jgi:hypothetical protein